MFGTGRPGSAIAPAVISIVGVLQRKPAPPEQEGWELWKRLLSWLKADQVEVTPEPCLESDTGSSSAVISAIHSHEGRVDVMLPSGRVVSVSAGVLTHGLGSGHFDRLKRGQQVSVIYVVKMKSDPCKKKRNPRGKDFLKETFVATKIAF